MIMGVLTICLVKLMQSTALEENCFDLSLSPALCNLQLLLVIIKKGQSKVFECSTSLCLLEEV